ncbi:MAG: hypothetical protein VB858_06425, partial [Planctomycetaceae bacterium]
MFCQPRPTRKASSVRPTRCGSTEAIAVAAVCFVGMLVASGFLFFRVKPVQRTQTPILATVRQVTEADVSVCSVPVTASETRVVSVNEQASVSSDSPQPESVRDTESVVAERPAPASSRSEIVAAHLEYGEFSNAIEVARSADDRTERSELLQQVAQAQMKIGDFDAAMGSIRGMPDYNVRLDARAEHTAQQAMAGGSQADFTELISLIQSETNGMWEDVDGAGGTISQFQQGVHVDPAGILELSSAADHAGRLKELGIEARSALLNGDIAENSNLRVISLTRLEQAVAQRISEGKLPVESQRLMGGLTKITHVFVYENDGEIVVAGPAEGWKYNANGIPIGTRSGRPVLQLDDFVDVLRAFTGSGQKFFSCSIDPKPAGLKALKDYVASTS